MRPKPETWWPPATLGVSALAALTTWCTLLTWSGFAERSSAYLVPLLGVALLVAVGGALARSARLPAVVVLVAQTVVVALWLHAEYTSSGQLAGWLPTPTSVAELRLVVADAVAVSRDYAAPVPRTVPEFAPLMVLCGAGSLLLVDFLVLGLRRAPLAGLPLLAVYTTPVSILPQGVSWLKFAVAALLFLLLITTQEADRLARWGQAVTGPRLHESRGGLLVGRGMWSSARRIGFSATGLAVLIPLLVPTFSLRPFDGPGGPGGNGAAVTLANPIADMRRDLTRGADVDLVRVETDQASAPAYLRTTVLDSFDGDTWRPAERSIPVDQRAEGLLPRAPGLDADVDRRTDPWVVTTSQSFDSPWLPAPYPSYSLEAPGDWRYDLSTMDFVSAADERTAAGLRYELRATQLRPREDQLVGAGPAPSSVFAPGTELPEGVPDFVGELANRVTAGRDTPYEQAAALQRWFRRTGGFEYSLQRESGNGVAALEDFLRGGGRVGYCEQFASAMALMARTLSIPARVAVGFLQPERAGDEEYVFSAHDLHAWPELYFEGVGWVRFEPTPSARTGAAPAYTLPSGREPDEQPSEANSSAQAPRSAERFDQLAGGPDVSTDDGDSGGGGGAVVAGLGLLALVVGAVAPRLTRDAVRRRRWSAVTNAGELAETAWHEVRDSAQDLGLAWSDEVTLRTRARDLTLAMALPGTADDSWGRPAERGPHADPEGVAVLERLVRRLEVARYARPGTGSLGPAARDDGRDIVRGDAERVVASLATGAGRRRRNRARWLPASLLRRSGGGGRRRLTGARGGFLLESPR